MSDLGGHSMRIASGRWVKNAFVRENLVSALKTFAWLGPLTLLIWVYAERSQVVPVDNVSFPILVQSGDPSRYASMPANVDQNVIVKLTGARSRIENLRQRLRPEGTRPSVVINIDRTRPPGSYNLDTIALLNESNLFIESGVSITEARPLQLPIVIDVYEEREATVQPPSRVTNLVTTPSFVPDKVMVRAPRSYFESESDIWVEANLDGAGILDKPGTPHTVNVRVESPQLRDKPGVSYMPETVKTTVEVRAPDERHTIPQIQVSISAFPAFLERYDVALPENERKILDVEVTGPPDRVAAIREQLIIPFATVQVMGDDRPNPNGGPRTISRVPEIEKLPPGVSLVAPLREIEFIVTEKPQQQ